MYRDLLDPLPSVNLAVAEFGIDFVFALLLPPEDMQVVAAHVDPVKRSITFTVTGPNLQPVSEGELLPKLQVTYTQISEVVRREADWQQI